MEEIEDLSLILEMEMSVIVYENGLVEDQNEVESRRKGKEVPIYAETDSEIFDSHFVFENSDATVPNLSKHHRQVSAEESTVGPEEGEAHNEPEPEPEPEPELEPEPVGEPRRNRGPRGGADKEAKRLRRMLAKRLSAQRTRQRKRQYALELEAKMNSLELEVAVAPTRIKYFDRHIASLKMQCSLIEQKISVYANQLESKRAIYESMMREREKLTQLYMLQSQRRLRRSTMAANPAGLLPMNVNANWNLNNQAGGAGQLVGPIVPNQLMMGRGQMVGPMANLNLNQHAGPVQRLIEPAGLLQQLNMSFNRQTPSELPPHSVMNLSLNS